jgi:two-component system, OmpR family, phosphate regulon sensor histidine kinase PhoR
MPSFVRSLLAQQSLRRIILVLLVAALIGWASGLLLPILLITSIAIIGWLYFNLHALHEKSRNNIRFQNIDSKSIFNQLEAQLHRREYESRRRSRRLLSLLRAYRLAGESIHDGALILQRNSSRIVWFNKAAKGFLNLRYPRDIDRRFLEHLENKRIHDWFFAGDTEEALMDIASPHDENMRLSLRLLPYSNEQFLVVIRDVTKLMQLEHMRRDFVANVSHELRTPLTVVHGYLDMMEPDDNPEYALMIEEMRKQSHRMAQLMEDLLTLSRLDAQEALREEIIPMTAMLNTLKREAEALSQGRHRISIDDRAQCNLYGAHKELHSAFSNLVSNATRYTPTGGVINIIFDKDEKQLALRVQDSGYGIPAQHLPRITERFYRVSTSRSRESGGTGLGLSIVKHVLGLHQAHLDIESAVGKGSTFSCVFALDRIRQRTG